MTTDKPDGVRPCRICGRVDGIHDDTPRASTARAEAGEVARLRAALSELVALKDGPRGEDYDRRKPLAWTAARAVLGQANGDQT